MRNLSVLNKDSLFNLGDWVCFPPCIDTPDQIKELGIARRGRGLLLVPLECPRASLLLGCFEVAAC